MEQFKKDGFARLDDGALVIDVKEETDTKEIPPCLIQKSDGASLYGTTDLATIDPERMKIIKPNRDQSILLINVRRCILHRYSVPLRRLVLFQLHTEA